MGLVSSRRIGLLWDDLKTLNKIILDFPFNTTGKNERDFERGFSTSIIASKQNFNNKIICQIDKSVKVNSVFFFGKQYRPDLSIGEDGIAVEIKYFSYSEIKEAIGQAIIYRLRYKFVFIILVMNSSKKRLYNDISLGKEADLEGLLSMLSNKFSIYTYIVPSFNIKKPGIKKCIEFNK